MQINPTISAADRQKYRNYTDGSIRGILIIQSMTDSELSHALDNPEHQAAILSLIDRVSSQRKYGTNPFWLQGQLAEEALWRNLITADELRNF